MGARLPDIRRIAKDVRRTHPDLHHDELVALVAALLSHLPQLRRGAGDLDRFEQLADRMLDEQELFIRKAIGWVLRETGRQRPEAVAAWLERRAPPSA